MKTYVVGFAFDIVGKQVVLVKKDHPEWQKGKWNGIGGHIKSDETAIKAMVREFEEETGLLVGDSLWRNYLTIQYYDRIVYFLRTFLHINYLMKVKSITSEEIKIHEISELFQVPIIPNLTWIIPLAFDKYITITYSYQYGLYSVIE